MHGLGSDREAAVSDARALNAAIYQSIKSARLLSITNPEPSTPPFIEATKRHMELCEKDRKFSENTLRSRKSAIKALELLLGAHTPIGEITVRNIVSALESYNDRPRMKQSLRSTAIEIWKDSIQEGWVSDNVPAKTRSTTVVVMRSRLTLEDFTKIHQVALKQKDIWIARSMELALVTAQRREDISDMEFRQSQGSTAWLDKDALYVIQGKTSNRLKIPLDVSINGLTLADVVKSCRNAVVSRWLVHHVVKRTNSSPGDQVWRDTISRRFADMRDLAGVVGTEGKEPPSFHEIRSLAIRLYASKYGKDFAQSIAGHKDSATTDIYCDSRGSEWIQIRA